MHKLYLKKPNKTSKQSNKVKFMSFGETRTTLGLNVALTPLTSGKIWTYQCVLVLFWAGGLTGGRCGSASELSCGKTLVWDLNQSAKMGLSLNWDFGSQHRTKAQMWLWQVYSKHFLALSNRGLWMAFLDGDDVLSCPYFSYFGSWLHLALNI